MSGAPPGAAVLEPRAAAYFEALSRGDRPAALAQVRDALGAGLTGTEVLLDVVCAAQAHVGRLWQGGSWNVAQEHVATAISEAAVVVAAEGEEPADPVGHVVVACVDGEWHALPARVVAESLRGAGWRVTYLGASVPPAHLAQLVQDTGPDAVALSCSLPSTLPRARRAIEAARAAGAPVVVGGAGFGPDPLRATRLGAHGWAADARGADALLRDLRAELGPAPALTHAGSAEVPVLLSRRAGLVEATMGRLSADLPDVAAYDEDQVERSVEDLGHIVGFAAAALLVDDERVFTDFLDWTAAVLSARGVPPGVLATGLEELAVVLAGVPSDVRARVSAALPHGDLPVARELVAAGARQVRG